MSSIDQLTENDVVAAVCQYLESKGFNIERRLTTTQQGDDIVATQPGLKLCIEAKCATSARTGSRRFGRPFDSAQARVHVAEAVYRAIQVLSRPKDQVDIRAGIALPANDCHERELASVKNMLKQLRIIVFWVKGTDEVQQVN